MTRIRLESLVLAALFCAGAVAQQTASTAGTGTVTGHVMCGDTQRPARFANVTVFGVPVAATAMPNMDNIQDKAVMAAAMQAAMEAMNKTTIVPAQTDITGAFTARDVPPGDYYVFASEGGYVQPTNQVQELLNAGADVHKPLPGVTMVHVTAEHTSNADVTIGRGAAVSGTILWDDGTPVSGAMVTTIPAKSDAKQMPREFAMLAVSAGSARLAGLITDDLGHFRVAGLVAGDYVVQATLPMQQGASIIGGSFNMSKMLTEKPLVVFAPAVFHKADAKVVTLRAGEDQRDVIVTVNLGGMHTVSGRVGSVEDHHGLNSAVVRVTDAQDKDFSRAAFVDAAGNFSVTFVPSGSYNLTVTDGADTEPDKKSEDDDKKTFKFSDTHPVRSYDDAKQTLIVSDSDIAGLNLELTPSKTLKKDPEFGEVVQESESVVVVPKT
jgi:hypothetical protein